MFHLAIPSQDLKQSVKFYEKLGCNVGRSYDTHVVVDFFNHQLVLHGSDQIDTHPTMYPRHFGYIFATENAFFDFLQYVKVNLPEHIFEKYFARRVGEREEHHTFFLSDPSNNLIEFKWYRNDDSILR